MTKKYLLFLLVFILGFSSTVSIAETVVQLTDEELAYIEEHPVIKLGVDPMFKPFEFIDIDGEYKGLANDYISLINQKTGLNMVVVKMGTWDEAYTAAVEGELDCLPCISKTAMREEYFLFSKPYYQFKRVIIMRDTDNSVKSFRDLKTKTVGVQINSSHDSYLNDFPGISKQYFESVEDGLEALAHGQVDYFIGNLANTGYQLNNLGITHMKYVSFDDQSLNQLHFAVGKDQEILRDIINKGLDAITDAEIIEIRNRWIGMTNEVDYGAMFRIIGVVALGVIVILGVSWFWIIRLRSEIKKRIEIEKDLKEARIEAEVANEVKSNFLARMSHEIRTPLNAITGLSYLLYHSDVDQTQKGHIDKIKHASTVMLSIINDILDFSKIEAGKVDLEKVSFNLDDVVSNMLNIVAFKIDEKKLDFTLIKDPRLPEFFIGDAKRIEQVLLNIMNNAVKFTMAGGITLRVNLIGFKHTEYQIEFVIEDTGIGMSDAHLENLFEPFTQEDASITRRFGGTGLGLSIVKNLVELMDGSISVTSEVNVGSTFTLLLTLPKDVEKEHELNRGSDYTKNIKTLILNKDMETLKFLTENLRKFGIDAEFTSSNVQFNELVLSQAAKFKEPYDLVIVDDSTIEEGAIPFLSTIYDDDTLKVKPKAIIMHPFNLKNDEYPFNEHQWGITKPVFPSTIYNAIADIFKFDVVASQMEKANTMVRDYTHKGNVLIVEDNKTNQFIAKTLLESIGFTATVADHGEDGLRLWHENNYDIILMDLHMPVMNGYDATRTIRKEDQDIPIVAMTADALDTVKEKCLAYGFDHFISKPFDPDNFKEEIQEIFFDKNKDIMESVIVNRSVGLKMMGGSESLYDEIVQIFLLENVNTLNQLADAIERGDHITGRDIMHKVKSSSASLGSESVSSIARSLQEAFESNNEEQIQLLRTRFESSFNDLMMTLQDM